MKISHSSFARAVDVFTPEAFKLPPQKIRGEAPVVLSAWSSNFLYVVERAPYSVELEGRSHPHPFNGACRSETCLAVAVLSRFLGRSR